MKNLPTILVAAALAVAGLTACEAPADPCATGVGTPSAAQVDKVKRGLEVDESIEVNGSEVECVLVKSGSGYKWISESDD
jgi:hypothetical protein